MGKLPGREGPLVVIREPQRLLRGACERRVASAVMQARRMHVPRVAVRTSSHCDESAARSPEGAVLRVRPRRRRRVDRGGEAGMEDGLLLWSLFYLFFHRA